MYVPIDIHNGRKKIIVRARIFNNIDEIGEYLANDGRHAIGEILVNLYNNILISSRPMPLVYKIDIDRYGVVGLVYIGDAYRNADGSIIGKDTEYSKGEYVYLYGVGTYIYMNDSLVDINTYDVGPIEYINKKNINTLDDIISTFYHLQQRAKELGYPIHFFKNENSEVVLIRPDGDSHKILVGITRTLSAVDLLKEL